SRERDGDVLLDSPVADTFLDASMEPSRERDGDNPGAPAASGDVSLLQWSRRANATETRARPRFRWWRRGFNGAVARTRRRHAYNRTRTRRHGGLQWSRRANATETGSSGSR